MFLNIPLVSFPTLPSPIHPLPPLFFPLSLFNSDFPQVRRIFFPIILFLYLGHENASSCCSSRQYISRCSRLQENFLRQLFIWDRNTGTSIFYSPIPSCGFSFRGIARRFGLNFSFLLRCEYFSFCHCYFFVT